MPRPVLAAGVILAAAFAFLALRPVASNDAWWHLSMGRATLEAGSPVFAEPVALGAAEEYVNIVWLFDLPLYLLHRAGGWTAVNLGIAALAALCFLFAWLLARDLVGHGAPWTALALGALAAGGAHLRFIPRPQALFLTLLPLVIWLARRGTLGGGAAWTARVGLVAAVALWSQSHASAVIAPLVALLASLNATWTAERGWRWRGVDERSPTLGTGTLFGLPRGQWAALAVVAVLPLSGPSGLDLVKRVLAHRDNFTVERIAEMRPMSAELWLVPTRDVLIAEVLALAVLLGLLRRRAWPVGPSMLALLGLYLTLESNRFAAAWCLLLLPLVAFLWRPDGGLESRRRRLSAGLAVAAVPALLSLGSEAPSFAADAPNDVATALRALEVRGPLFNDYDSGGFLGWGLYGDVRVLIDSRSQMYFDLEELFAAERALADPRVFLPLVELHDFAAVAIPRRAPLCRGLDADPGWEPVWLGVEHVVFLPAGPTANPLVWLDPCAASVSLEDCRAAPSAELFLADFERLLALTPGEPHLGRQLALLALQCARPADLERAVAGLEAAAAESDHPDFAWLSAQVLLARGAAEPALELLAELPPSHVAGQLLRLRLLRRLDRPSVALPVARRQVEIRAEAAPPELRELLAWACEAAGDRRCAVRETLRAALAGHPEARRRLAEHRRRGWVPAALEPLAAVALGRQDGG